MRDVFLAADVVHEEAMSAMVGNPEQAGGTCDVEVDQATPSETLSPAGSVPENAIRDDAEHGESDLPYNIASNHAHFTLRRTPPMAGQELCDLF